MNSIKMDTSFLKDLKASELFTLMAEIAEEYTQRMNEFPGYQSTLDKEDQILIHEVETSRLNAADAYQLYDKMRKNRRVRRVVKNDLRFDRLLKQQGCSIQEIKNKLELGLNKEFSSNEQLISESDYLQEETFGKINRSEVDAFVFKLNHREQVILEDCKDIEEKTEKDQKNTQPVQKTKKKKSVKGRTLSKNDPINIKRKRIETEINRTIELVKSKQSNLPKAKFNSLRNRLTKEHQNVLSVYKKLTEKQTFTEKERLSMLDILQSSENITHLIKQEI